MSASPGEMRPHPIDLRAQLSEQILSAAAEELITAGIQNTTIADIASLAGLPDEVVYHLWPTIQELVTAVVLRDLGSRLTEVTSALQSCDQLDDQIAEAFAAVLWFLDSHPLVGGAVRSDAGMILPTAEISVSRIVGQGAAAITDHIGTVVTEHAGRSVDTDALTEILTRLIQSLLLTRGASMTPLHGRPDLVRYARRCVVPLVRAFVR